jgi:hypothetical protein
VEDKKAAIMQPYFLPYLGYFQLINSVDEFVLYDNIQFSKRSWIHRNRILEQNESKYVTLPLKKDSDYLDIVDRMLVPDFDKYRIKILSRIENSYAKSPYFNDIYPIVSGILNFNASNNLFEYVFNSIIVLCDVLDINTTLIISSQIDINHLLRSKEKVIKICKALEVENYINPEGGNLIYNKKEFSRDGVKLNFLKMEPIIYKQFNTKFQSHLSIIDVLMFNGIEKVKSQLLYHYDLI